MHSFTVLTILVAVIGSVVAPNPATYAPRTSSTLRVFESLRESPQGWTKLEKPNPAKRLRLRIALQEPDHELFEKTLFAVSDPEHPSYGQHLKRHEVKALIKPRDDSTEAVISWLKGAGIQDADIENNGEWVNFYVSVSKAEEMLDTEFNYWRQEGAKSRSKEIRTLKYSVPLGVSSHIVMIQPTTRFGQLMAQGSHSFVMSHINADTQAKANPIPGLKVNETCKSVITPECLRSMYNVGDYRADSRSGSLLGVCGYLNQIAKYDAYEAFTDKYAPYAKNQNFSYVQIKGGMNDQLSNLDDTEANLDIQYAGAMGYKQKLRYYSTAGLGPLIPDLDQPTQDRNQNEPYMDFLDYILGLDDDDLPQTLTTSYGEDEQSLPDSYAKTVCNMFGQLGMRGVSVLFSSGDTGVGSACQTNDGKNTTRFLPIFPAACPYVTSVGATFNYPEEAIFFSSGGFSDKWPRPSYQDAAIPTYLKTLGSQWNGLYNPKGRGFPDVAAQGSNFAVYHRDKSNQKLEVILVGGTSASAPAFAGIVSLLNNARLQIGQRPLGFLNPWLYSRGKDGLNDVVLGGSKGCTGRDIYSGLKTPLVPFASWNATKGWDPVTGLGTPDFAKLLEISTPRNRLPHIRNCPDEFC
ncbi:putative Tripeptidyl-peptidase sed2 [Tricladium varicosporioides]|nr:putative Tripeptidyl-peptidase sed2 [Hymenoscyphus varicosporioides]